MVDGESLHPVDYDRAVRSGPHRLFSDGGNASEGRSTSRKLVERKWSEGGHRFGRETTRELRERRRDRRAGHDPRNY